MGPRPLRHRTVARTRLRDERPTFVRFVCFHLVEGQRARLGLFQALDNARQSDQAAPWALEQLNELNDWFSDNLAVPTRFERRAGGQSALSWFKPTAAEHISRMHALKTALEACGVHVEVVTSRTPGVILYEDEHQIAAEPGAGRF